MFVQDQQRVATSHPTHARHSPKRPYREVIAIDETLYTRHPHGGGLVSVEASVSPHVYVAPNARIEGRAIVSGGVRLFHGSVIGDGAVVVWPSTLRGAARIGDSATVRGAVTMGGSATVGGSTVLIGTFRLSDSARLHYGAHWGGASIA